MGELQSAYCSSDKSLAVSSDAHINEAAPSLGILTWKRLSSMRNIEAKNCARYEDCNLHVGRVANLKKNAHKTRVGGECEDRQSTKCEQKEAALCVRVVERQN